MVVVMGAVVKEAGSAEELMTLFEEGSSSRHVASTKMNSESSRSHLVLSIVIESTNLTSGAVVKGKVSLLCRLYLCLHLQLPYCINYRSFSGISKPLFHVFRLSNTS